MKLLGSLSAIVFLALLSACLPQAATGRPEVVFLNGPRADFVVVAAETVQELAAERDDLPFSVTGNTTARFLETRRGISGRRAPLAAASVADGLGAVRAVLIGVPQRDREVMTFAERGQRTVFVTVRLLAQVIDAGSGEVLATVTSRSYGAGREESIDPPLVELDDDPTVMALVEVAAEEVVAAIIEAVGRSLAGP